MKCISLFLSEILSAGSLSRSYVNETSGLISQYPSFCRTISTALHITVCSGISQRRGLSSSHVTSSPSSSSEPQSLTASKKDPLNSMMEQWALAQWWDSCGHQQHHKIESARCSCSASPKSPGTVPQCPTHTKSDVHTAIPLSQLGLGGLSMSKVASSSLVPLRLSSGWKGPLLLALGCNREGNYTPGEFSSTALRDQVILTHSSVNDSHLGDVCNKEMEVNKVVDQMLDTAPFIQWIERYKHLRLRLVSSSSLTTTNNDNRCDSHESVTSRHTDQVSAASLSLFQLPDPVIAAEKVIAKEEGMNTHRAARSINYVKTHSELLQFFRNLNSRNGASPSFKTNPRPVFIDFEHEHSGRHYRLALLQISYLIDCDEKCQTIRECTDVGADDHIRRDAPVVHISLIDLTALRIVEEKAFRRSLKYKVLLRRKKLLSQGSQIPQLKEGHFTNNNNTGVRRRRRFIRVPKVGFIIERFLWSNSRLMKVIHGGSGDASLLEREYGYYRRASMSAEKSNDFSLHSVNVVRGVASSVDKGRHPSLPLSSLSYWYDTGEAERVMTYVVMELLWSIVIWSPDTAAKAINAFNDMSSPQKRKCERPDFYRVLDNGRRDVVQPDQFISDKYFPQPIINAVRGAVGLHTLLKRYNCGHVKDTSQTMQNWSVRPLSKRAMLYAADDVKFLPDIFFQQLHIMGFLGHCKSNIIGSHHGSNNILIERLQSTPVGPFAHSVRDGCLKSEVSEPLVDTTGHTSPLTGQDSPVVVSFFEAVRESLIEIGALAVKYYSLRADVNKSGTILNIDSDTTDRKTGRVTPIKSKSQLSQSFEYLYEKCFSERSDDQKMSYSKTAPFFSAFDLLTFLMIPENATQSVIINDNSPSSTVSSINDSVLSCGLSSNAGRFIKLEECHANNELSAVRSNTTFTTAVIEADLRKKHTSTSSPVSTPNRNRDVHSNSISNSKRELIQKELIHRLMHRFIKKQMEAMLPLEESVTSSKSCDYVIDQKTNNDISGVLRGVLFETLGLWSPVHNGEYPKVVCHDHLVNRNQSQNKVQNNLVTGNGVKGECNPNPITHGIVLNKISCGDNGPLSLISGALYSPTEAAQMMAAPITPRYRFLFPHPVFIKLMDDFETLMKPLKAHLSRVEMSSPTEANNLSLLKPTGASQAMLGTLRLQYKGKKEQVNGKGDALSTFWDQLSVEVSSSLPTIDKVNTSETSKDKFNTSAVRRGNKRRSDGLHSRFVSSKYKQESREAIYSFLSRGYMSYPLDREEVSLIESDIKAKVHSASLSGESVFADSNGNSDDNSDVNLSFNVNNAGAGSLLFSCDVMSARTKEKSEFSPDNILFHLLRDGPTIATMHLLPLVALDSRIALAASLSNFFHLVGLIYQVPFIPHSHHSFFAHQVRQGRCHVPFTFHECHPFCAAVCKRITENIIRESSILRAKTKKMKKISGTNTTRSSDSLAVSERLFSLGDSKDIIRQFRAAHTLDTEAGKVTSIVYGNTQYTSTDTSRILQVLDSTGDSMYNGSKSPPMILASLLATLVTRAINGSYLSLYAATWEVAERASKSTVEATGGIFEESGCPTGSVIAAVSEKMITPKVNMRLSPILEKWYVESALRLISGSPEAPSDNIIGIPSDEESQCSLTLYMKDILGVFAELCNECETVNTFFLRDNSPKGTTTTTTTVEENPTKVSSCEDTNTTNVAESQRTKSHMSNNMSKATMNGEIPNNANNISSAISRPPSPNAANTVMDSISPTSAIPGYGMPIGAIVTLAEFASLMNSLLTLPSDSCSPSTVSASDDKEIPKVSCPVSLVRYKLRAHIGDSPLVVCHEKQIAKKIVEIVHRYNIGP